MTIALAAAAVSFFATLILGVPYLAFLRRAGLGKQVRADGPTGHLVKMGTPTLGGLLFTATVVAQCSMLAVLVYGDDGRSILLPMGIMLVCALIGACDDLLSLVGSSAGGLRARTKFALLGLVGLGSALLLWHPEVLGIDVIYVPGSKTAIHLGPWILPLAALAVMGSAHAVNLTDGLDGLAGHTAAVAYVAYGTIAYLQGQLFLVTFCFTVAGALLAFLWFNAYPAQVFMGDAGALALGGTLAVVALMLGQVLLLPIVGFVFVVVTLSVIAQVGFFKLTHGRRLLRMAPLHNHFELMGWSQMQVAQRFWLVSMITGLLGVALALL